MHGNYSVVDAGPVRRSGYYSRERLLRNRAEVGHGEAESTQSGVKPVERDAGFGYDETFFSIDLIGGKKRRERKKTGG